MSASLHVMIHLESLFDINKFQINCCIVNKNDTTGKISFDYTAFEDYVDFLHEESKLILNDLKSNVINKLASHWYNLGIHNGRGETVVHDELAKHLQKSFRKVFQKMNLRIFIADGKVARLTTKKLYTTQSYLPLPIFKLIKIEEKYNIDVKFQLNDVVVDEKECIRNRFFLTHEDKIFVLSYSDSVLLDWLTKNGSRKLYTNYNLINEKVLSRIERLHKVDRTDAIETTYIAAAPAFKIYIRESLGTYLIIEPKVQYDEVAFDDLYKNEQKQSAALVRGLPYLVERALHEEKSFIETIRSLHPNFKNQFNNSFQINFGEAGKKQWFYKFYMELIEMQVDIIGMDLMLHFRYSMFKPETEMQLLETAETYFVFQFELKYGKEVVPLQLLQKSLRNQQSSFPLRDNSIAILTEEWLKQYASIIKHGKVVEQTIAISKNFLIANKLNFNEGDISADELISDDWLQDWMNWQDINFGALVEPNVSATLRPYQQKGIDWLYLLHRVGAGALLADDMGLGKTLQTIAYLSYTAAKTANSRFLVIAPASLIYNWQAEVEKFAPHLTLQVYYGVQRNWEEINAEEPNIIITTYHICRNDIEKISENYFDIIVLDESHNIKNSTAGITLAAMQLNGGFKIALSGTPVMNNTFDLYSQFSFALPGLFYSKNFFNSEYAIPIDEQKDEQKLLQLQKLTSPYILRRTKEQVATDLPPKVESVMWCTMKDEQRKLYDSIKNNEWKKLSKTISDDGVEKSMMMINTAMLRLRQICDAPMLLPESFENTVTQSIKLELIVDEIVNNTGNDKVVVFSQFTSMMDLMKVAFDDAGISYFSFDGSTTANKRAELIAAFQSPDNDTKVFIISLKAGGVGITLTAASYVYVVDPWWNKAVENQAIDRLYRIGQKKTVFAYKMVCKNSIEERILQLQERKSKLSDSLIAIEEDFVKKLDQDDLAFIFS